jgi:hypothetical protein
MQQDWSGSVRAVQLKELRHWSRLRSDFAEPQSRRWLFATGTL